MAAIPVIDKVNDSLSKMADGKKVRIAKRSGAEIDG